MRCAHGLKRRSTKAWALTDQARQLFVVGSPRSGTTLLRNLLHGHSSIALTTYESHFVPGVLRQYGPHPQIDSPDEVRAFVARFKRGLLYQKGQERGVFCPSDAELAKAIDGDSWAEVLRNLFDLYCDKEMAEARIWGDKTPSYVDHLDLIDSALPNARFVHIIRDPRDQALSERAIWGKSLRRSADAWQRRVVRARSSRPSIENRYIELTYESLAKDPETELQRLTDWLGVDFEPAMLRSAAGSDELGQMVGAKSVSDAAIGGRRGRLSQREEAAIASLTRNVGVELGYDLPASPPHRIRKIELPFLALHDRIGLLAYFIRNKGPLRGLKFFVGSFVDSSRS
jgi:Sulfotransferase family